MFIDNVNVQVCLLNWQNKTTFNLILRVVFILTRKVRVSYQSGGDEEIRTPVQK